MRRKVLTCTGFAFTIVQNSIFAFILRRTKNT